jgi:hypothetical protein
MRMQERREGRKVLQGVPSVVPPSFMVSTMIRRMPRIKEIVPEPTIVTVTPKVVITPEVMVTVGDTEFVLDGDGNIVSERKTK